ncbi:hypothetical protein BGZ83_008767 [Gryganskiella cystojenkinii]|nr:hypothetical protein BGZ83_008767 [Gryganskiella cystojenkinii]
MGKETDVAYASTHRTHIDDDLHEEDVHALGLPDYTSAPLASHSLSTQICCISMHHSDQIRLINTPEELTAPIRDVILSTWGSIQKESQVYRSYQFKMLGTPWMGSGPDSVKARRLVCQMMKCMAERGWTLIEAATVSKHLQDLDALYFERLDGGGAGRSSSRDLTTASSTSSSSNNSQGIIDPNVEMFVITFGRTDLIRLIDAPLNMVPLVRETLLNFWPDGIDTDGEFAGSHEFKMKGRPFYAYKEKTINCRIMLCQVLVTLRNQGFKLYSSVDVTRGQEGRELDSWVLRRVGSAWS